jgi:Lipocalin-like domain
LQRWRITYRNGRPRLSSESVRSAPLPTGQQVVHHVVMALNPNFVGTDPVRNVAFDAQGLLTLSATDTLPGSPPLEIARSLT